jgi:hypothetical protein
MTTLQTLGQSLDHWQALYIVAISLALISTFSMVFFAFHKEHPVALRTSNYVYVIASLLAVLSTIVIVNKTKSLDAEKDRQAKIITDAANVKIAQANSDADAAKATAKIADQKAQEARAKAVEAENANLILQGKVATESTRAATAEAGLAKANKDTSDFAHAIATQQQNMQQQAKVSPVLDQAQVAALASVLRGHEGQSVAIHMTLDTVVIRLAQGIEAALQMAGITPSGSMDAGQTYQGVSVVVHSPQDVPPLADSLVLGLRQAGIEVNPASLPTVPAGQVAIYLGPN